MNPPSTNFDLITAETLVEFLQNPQLQLEASESAEGVAMGSTLGQVRKENQDRHLVVRYSHPDASRSFFMAVVADGVGSLPQSGLAAAAAISAFVSSVVAAMENRSFDVMRSGWERVLREAVQHANRYTYGKTSEDGASTLSIVVVPANGSPCGVHVGDSKVYSLNGDFVFTQLSIDQTVGSQLYSLGIPQDKLAGRDVRFDRALAQYIGMSDDVQPQYFIVDTSSVSVLIASDGIAAARKSLSDGGWRLISQSSMSRGDFVKKILHLNNWLGGDDNSTIVIFPLSKELLPANRRRDTIVLNATSGSRTIEIRNRPIVQPQAIINVLPADPKRQEQGKFKRGRKFRIVKLKTNIDKNTEPKRSPSITFLPGLSKGENPTKP